MDLDEWELLPRYGLIIHPQTHTIPNLSNTKSVIDMNYFQNCMDHSIVKHCLEKNDQTSKGSHDQENETCIDHGDVKHCPDQIDQKQGSDQEDKNGIDHRAVKHTSDQTNEASKEVDDQETIKMEENKFVDIKMDCPMSENKGVSICEEKDGELQEDEGIKKEEDDDRKHGGLNNVWKWAMSGIGAVFSFGFVAASLSLVALGKRSCTKEDRSYNTSEIHFQIYTHDKRMKRVVKRTKRLNETIAAVRGAPYMTRAHITVGGYYDGL